jgi:hypothetical protein
VAEKLTGTPISGGDYGTAYSSKAFDNNTATYWMAPQLYTAGQNVAYIGLNLGRQARIGQVSFLTYTADHSPRTIAVRLSDNGLSWRTIKTITGFAHSTEWQDIQIDSLDYGSYVSVLCVLISATSTTNHSSFVLKELAFYGKEVARSPNKISQIISTFPASLTRGFR